MGGYGGAFGNNAAAFGGNNAAAFGGNNAAAFGGNTNAPFGTSVCLLPDLSFKYT